MKKIIPTNPKGVRDYLPEENKKREYIIDILKKEFEIFGFQSIYTPVIENYNTLVGKYGDEGDKLLFKILNSGDYLSKINIKELSDKDDFRTANLTPQISSKGLRYDHTVPLARFVAQHQNELTFPFKRYVIAPVWRADRPQKGRYQEFYQCDIDIVGSNSLMNDIEILSLTQNVFTKLDLNVDININSRKIFQGICREYNLEEHMYSISVIIDKLDKIGVDNVLNELYNIENIDKTRINKLFEILKSNDLENILINNQLFIEGKEELLNVIRFTNSQFVKINLSLMRGLDYYTGVVFEITSKDINYGSLASGGRYDNLTEIFGLKDKSGIGISFGLDRIFDVMSSLNKFSIINSEKRYLILNLLNSDFKILFDIQRLLHNKNITASIYPNIAKFDKQITYASKSNFTDIIIIGEQEYEEKKVKLKNLLSREQLEMDYKEFINSL